MKKRIFFLFFICHITFFLSTEAISSKLEKKIEETINYYLKKEQITSYQLVDVRTEGLGGQSGDIVYFVKNNSGRTVLVVKAFITKKHRSRFHYECRAITFFKNLVLESVDPVQIVFTHEGNSFDLLGMTPAPGKSVLQLIKVVNQYDSGTSERKRAFNTLLQAIDKVGAAFAQLHGHKEVPIRMFPQKEMRRYQEFVTSFCRELKSVSRWRSPLKEKTLQAAFTKLLKRHVDEPGCYCYVHGDAHPGNVFYDKHTDKITFIDVSCTNRYLDEHENPQGFAANDFCHFLMGASFMAPNYFTDHEVRALKKTFYHAYDRHLDGNAVAFYNLYWIMRRMDCGFAMMRSFGGGSKYEMLKDQTQDYCALITQKNMVAV